LRDKTPAGIPAVTMFDRAGTAIDLALIVVDQKNRKLNPA
jgi:hypothetical protein